MVNLKSLFYDVVNSLQESDIDSAEFEAKELISHFLNVSRTQILTGEDIACDEKIEALNAAVVKRKTRYPLQYILGEWEFYGLPFKVGEGVLIPRADTEILCEVSLDFLEKYNCAKAIDICSGSGCIAITLDKQSTAKHEIYALEKYEAALKFLRENIALNDANIKVLHDDALAPTTDVSEFDLIVSNPPYISGADMKLLQTEVNFEPKTALFAECEGLYFYEKITEIWAKKLKDNGLLAFEIGMGYEDAVGEILKRAGLKNIKQYKDLSGIIRVVTASKIMEE